MPKQPTFFLPLFESLFFGTFLLLLFITSLNCFANCTSNNTEKQLKDDASKSDPNKYFAVHLTPEQVHLSLGGKLQHF